MPKLRLLFLLLVYTLRFDVACAQDAVRPVTGEAKAAFLQTWNERLQAMHSLHMVFTQEKHLRLVRRPLISQGELWLKGEVLRYVLKNTAGETELELRLDPQSVKTYYPQLRTLEVIELRAAQALSLPMPFLSRGPAALQQEYDTELFMASERYTLRLVPRNANSPVAEMRLILQNFQPQEFAQAEKNGNRLIMRIAAFTLNTEISEAQLALHVPEGTKVTHPLQQ
jgi:outer membrane lipoprotein-sorting protein